MDRENHFQAEVADLFQRLYYVLQIVEAVDVAGAVKRYIHILAWLEPEIRSEFVSHLATGGADGTLLHRYHDEAARRRVRAKTGTLRDTSALTGHVLAPPGTSPVCFSIIVNKAPGRVAVFRTFQEKIVTEIAKFLWN